MISRPLTALEMEERLEAEGCLNVPLRVVAYDLPDEPVCWGDSGWGESVDVVMVIEGEGQERADAWLVECSAG